VTPTVGADGQIAVRLPTPKALSARGLDLSGGNPSLAWLNLRDVVVLGGDLVAVAAGTRGVWIVDIANRDAPALVAEVALETTAHRLLRAGTRLYVLGTYLTVLDLSNPRAPVEQKQLVSTTDTAASHNTELAGTGDGDGASAVHFHSASHGGRVWRTTVRVTIDHPRPADLVMKLVPDKALNLPDIVLWDHRAAAGGLRTFTFSSTNLVALRALDGTFADGFWQLEVTDDVGNGDSGSLVSSQLEFVTRSRAARVLPGASELAGVTSWGDLVVAGAGLEVLDVAVPRWITSLSRVTGIATNTATMVGDVAIVSAALEGKNPDGTPATGRLRGLCAVDVSLALLPRVVRCDTALGGAPGDFAHVGGRLYLTVGDRCAKGEECPPPSTVIGDAARFARNWTWRLGITPLRVDRWAVGWNGSLWTLGDTGAIDQLNVANPAAVSLVERFPRTYAARIVPLALPEVMLFDFAPTARVATLGQAVSHVSRAYRLTVTASDAAGNTTRATRHVHVVPYNHGTNPPTLSVLPPRWGSDLSEVMITTTDADAAATWDPFRFARVDFEGDGAFDTEWLWMGNDGTGTFQTSAPAPASASARTAVVEVRDGFWATARGAVVIPAP
jgi:subtilisin-like proprotein convertase family protein